MKITNQNLTIIGILSVSSINIKTDKIPTKYQTIRKTEKQIVWDKCGRYQYQKIRHIGEKIRKKSIWKENKLEKCRGVKRKWNKEKETPKEKAKKEMINNCVNLCFAMQALNA